MNLVTYIFHKNFHSPNKVRDAEDHIQDGMEGLCMAALKFDPNKGFKFGTFAYPYVLGIMQRRSREFGYDTPYRIPRRILDDRIKILRYTKLNPDATHKEISKYLKISEERVADAISVSVFDSLDRDIEFSESENALSNIIPDKNAETALFSVESDQFCSYVIEIVNSMEYKLDVHKNVFTEIIFDRLYSEERVPRIYYADKYGLSQTQVSRIFKIYSEKLYKEIMKEFG